MSEDTENMNQENQNDPENSINNEDDLSPEKEKSILMDKAKLMGLRVSNNIGLDTLRDRVREAQEGNMTQNDEGNQGTQQTSINPLASSSPSKTGKTKTLRQHIHDEQMKLVRIRVTCMNPRKADLPGEIVTVANEFLGTVRKFVPYGEATEDGYHVPYCIYTQLKARKFWQTRTIKERRTGTERVETTEAREFSLEILPPLTQEELDRLAVSQSAAGSFSN